MGGAALEEGPGVGMGTCRATGIVNGTDMGMGPGTDTGTDTANTA